MSESEKQILRLRVLLDAVTQYTENHDHLDDGETTPELDAALDMRSELETLWTSLADSNCAESQRKCRS